MNFIVISNKPYPSDFRKYLMRAAARQGAKTIHICSGGELTVHHNEKIVATYSNRTPLNIILNDISKITTSGKTILLVGLGLSGRSIPLVRYLKKSFLKPIIFYDVFDYFRYGANIIIFMRKLLIDLNWRLTSDKTLILDEGLQKLYPFATHFDNASHLMPLKPTATANARRIIYIGSVDERVDFDWLDILTEQDITLDIYGCIHKNTLKIEILMNDFLKRKKNVTFHGSYDNDNLPKILENYHVGIVPYKTQHTLTEHINPDKVYHYLNAGLKVIASPIPQTLRLAPYLTLAKTRDEIIRALNDLDQSEKRITWPVADYSWDKRWQELGLIAQSVDKQ